MLATLATLFLVLLLVYIFFAFGLPKIVSVYISGKFKADVCIGSINLFRRELKKIRFVNKSSQGHLTLCVQNIKLTTNFFSETCSSLLTLKIHGIEARFTRDDQKTDPAGDYEEQEFKANPLQKIISTLAFVKFLFTFTFENVHVYVESSGKFTTVSVSKADLYTETTRAGFLNLTAEVESADVQGPQLAFGSTQNCKIIGVFCLASANQTTLDHLEICSTHVKSNVPIPLMKQTKFGNSKSKFSIPNLTIAICDFDVTASYEKFSWSSTLTNFRVNHNKADKKAEINIDEIGISDDKGSFFIQQFKLNRLDLETLVTWSHISVQSNVDSLDTINLVRMKYLEIYQGPLKRRYMEDTSLAIEISGGTMESTESNLALHVQQVISKIGQLENSKAGNNFYLDNFHLDFDKEQNELAGTVANIGMALCEDSLSIVFEWCSSVIELGHSGRQNDEFKTPSKIKWSLRSQSIQVDFTMENDLTCQLLIESTKSKGQGSLKGIGLKALSLVLKEPNKDLEMIQVLQVLTDCWLF